MQSMGGENALHWRLDHILGRRWSKDGCRFGYFHWHGGSMPDCSEGSIFLVQVGAGKARMSSGGRKLGMR